MSAFKLQAHTSSAAAKTAVRDELFASAHIAMDTLVANIQLADTITLILYPSGTLQKMTTNAHNDMEFIYSIDLLSNNASYHRLQMDNNELASNLADIRISLEGSIITIYILTDDHITVNRVDDGIPYIKYNTMKTQPVELMASVNVSGKSVTIT
jgi:hypothetical protein